MFSQSFRGGEEGGGGGSGYDDADADSGGGGAKETDNGPEGKFGSEWMDTDRGKEREEDLNQIERQERRRRTSGGGGFTFNLFKMFPWRCCFSSTAHRQHLDREKEVVALVLRKRTNGEISFIVIQIVSQKFHLNVDLISSPVPMDDDDDDRPRRPCFARVDQNKREQFSGPARDQDAPIR